MPMRIPLRSALLAITLLAPLSAEAPEPLRERLKASLVQFRALSPEQQQGVLARLEAEAKVTSPSLRPLLLAMLTELRKPQTEKLPPGPRLQQMLERLAALPPAKRQKAIARMEALATAAPPELKRFWELLLETARAMP